MPPFYIALLTVNVAVFCLYGWDKWCAKRQRGRVPESTLALPAAFLGAPGAWLGVYAFRHKTRKKSFLLKLSLATLANGLWLWLFRDALPF